MTARTLAAALLLAAWQGDPPDLVIASAGRERQVRVRTDRGSPAVAAPALAEVLSLEVASDIGSVVVTLGGRSFRFYLGASFVAAGDSILPLVAPPYIASDTLYLPMQWLTEYVPRLMPARFHFDPARRRLEEIPPVILARAPSSAAPAPPAAARFGLRWRHVVTVDPGHGGVDPGNPGKFFPAGVREKHITLDVSREIAAELERRGIEARLTRTRDTLIAWRDRAGLCTSDCDLFVSVHVNAMPAGRRNEIVRGLETYFLSEAKTEDARRVAEMENEAIRFETATPPPRNDPLGFMIKELQMTEHLRESARLAELVHTATARRHPGGERGVRQAIFMVLTTARRPAILVEVGFATNRADARFLTSGEGKRDIARGVADGIVAYLLEYERRLGGGGTGTPSGHGGAQ